MNSSTPQTVTTTTGNSVTVTAPVTTAGPFVYALTGVKDGTSTACTQPQTGTATVTVNPLPTATIGSDASVCVGGTAPVITFTGAGGTAPYTFTYTINSGTPQTVTTTTGNSVTVTAPVTTAGPFVYALTGVKDGTSTACTQPHTACATVTVNPLPTATIG